MTIFSLARVRKSCLYDDDNGDDDMKDGEREMANQGIMHAAYKTGGDALCKTRRSIMTLNIEEFRVMLWQPCKRCAAKVAKMDTKKANKEKGA